MSTQSVRPREKARPLNGVYGALCPPPTPALEIEGKLRDDGPSQLGGEGSRALGSTALFIGPLLAILRRFVFGKPHRGQNLFLLGRVFSQRGAERLPARYRNDKHEDHPDHDQSADHQELPPRTPPNPS